MLHTTTPAYITEPILHFCKRINPTSSPVFLDVVKTRYAVEKACFSNVKFHVLDNGGSKQLGWIVWETPGILIEAELHAVWLTPDGKLRDITPQLDGEKRILFLPDDTAVEPVDYDAVAHKNHRLALIEDPLMYDAIRAMEERDAIRARTGILVDDTDLGKMSEIRNRITQLNAAILAKYR